MQDKVYNVKVDGVQDAQKDMSNLNKTVEKTETDFKTLSKAISDGTKQLAAMKLQGQEGTKAYDDLARSLGNMKDALGDARAAVNAYANDTKNLTDALDVFKTGTSVVGLYQSSLVALGKDGKQAEEVIKKLVAAETALNSIQKIQATLMNKSSGTYRLLHKLKQFIIGDTKKEVAETNALTSAQNANTTATKASTLALRGLKVALVSTGIGAIVVAVGELIANFDKVTDAIKNIRKEAGPLYYAFLPLIETLNLLISGWDLLSGKAEKTAEDLKKLSKENLETSKARAIAEKDYEKALNINLKQQNAISDSIDIQRQQMDSLIAIQTKFNKARGEELKELEESIRLGNEKIEISEKQIKWLEEQKKIQKEVFFDIPILYDSQIAYYNKQIKRTKDEIDESIKKKYELLIGTANKTEEEINNNNKQLEVQNKLNILYIDRIKLQKEHSELEEKLANSKSAQLKEEIEINEARETGYKWTKKGYETYKNYYKALLDELDKESSAYKKYYKEWLSYDRDYREKIDENKNKAAEKAKKAEEKRLEEERKAFEDNLNYELELLKLHTNDYDIIWSRRFSNNEALYKKSYLTESEYLQNRDLLYAEYNRHRLDEDLKFRDEAIKNAEDVKNKTNAALDDMWREFDEINEEAKKKYEENKEIFLAITNGVLDTVSGITDSIFELIDANIQRSIDSIEKAINSIDSMLEKVDRNINRHINRLTGYYEALSDTTGEEKQDMLAYIKDQEDALNHQYDLEKQLEAEKYQREKQLQKEQAIQQKKQLQNQLIQAIITGAANTLNGFNTQPFMPVGIAMGALAATLSAVQIGVIGANIGRIKYANGGLLSGPSHNDGGIPVGNTGVEVEGGEYVVNKKATAKYLPLLEQINDYGSSVRKFANGGEMNLTTGSDQTAALLSNINFNPVVAVTDINRANSRLDKVKVLSR